MDELLTTALEALKERWLENPEVDVVYSENYTRNFHSGENERESILRLDTELVGDTRSMSPEEVIENVLTIMRLDVRDLLENGDRDVAADPLLKVMDGSKKLGKELELVDFPVSQMFTEYKWRKDTTEVTIYFRLYVKWK